MKVIARFQGFVEQTRFLRCGKGAPVLAARPRRPCHILYARPKHSVVYAENLAWKVSDAIMKGLWCRAMLKIKTEESWSVIQPNANDCIRMKILSHFSDISHNPLLRGVIETVLGEEVGVGPGAREVLDGDEGIDFRQGVLRDLSGAFCKTPRSRPKVRSAEGMRRRGFARTSLLSLNLSKNSCGK